MYARSLCHPLIGRFPFKTESPQKSRTAEGFLIEGRLPFSRRSQSAAPWPAPCVSTSMSVLYIVTWLQAEKKEKVLDKVFYFCNAVSGRRLNRTSSLPLTVFVWISDVSFI